MSGSLEIQPTNTLLCVEEAGMLHACMLGGYSVAGYRGLGRVLGAYLMVNTEEVSETELSKVQDNVVVIDQGQFWRETIEANIGRV
jgi:hypothetical protein